MSQSAAIWLVIVAAFAAANLPFLSQRWLLLGPRPQQGAKPLLARLGELLLLYALVGGLAFVLERRAGQVAPQGWEFYAVTAALFITFAFPGFVYRYLLRHRH
ncbi:DUF2818 family protein [Acidovorax sp. HDW3]|uniref:DUF2818 family protein n=1 Tax=Acidovorax sp. HDW3 TaxID=2714923 RepID=UPI001409C4A7|nr:DUF2818 family protein [Acidovorax sp. HDW3]QIL43335.1 DUF2818 family protein [Acidovorax sp. HDW3]